MTLLGGNGEPRANVRLNLKINHVLLEVKNKEFTLQTDNHGQIYLGELKDVNFIFVVCNYKYENLTLRLLL